MGVRTRWGLVLACAFTARMLAGFGSGSTEGGDAPQYLLMAHNLAFGHGLSMSHHAPYVPTDWRLPAYSAVLVPVQWLHAGHAGAVVLNSILGTIGVAGMIAIARAVFVGKPRVQFGVGLAAALFPPAVTYSGLVLSENLLLATAPWLIYLLFFSPTVSVRPRIWLLGLFVSGSLISLDRAEGIAFSFLATLVALAVWRPRRTVALGAVAVLLVAPVGWTIRNRESVHRTELSDGMYRDVNLLQTFTHGSQTSPLFLKGVALSYDGTSSQAQRTAYEHQVSQLIARTPLGGVVKYKVKANANLLFVPPVWNWAIEDFNKNYTLGDAIRNPGVRNGIRILWSIVLLGLYVLAAVGLVRWWRSGRRLVVFSMLVYPCLELLICIPFQADPRQWLLAAFIAIVPAVEGGLWLVETLGLSPGSWEPIVGTRELA